MYHTPLLLLFFYSKKNETYTIEGKELIKKLNLLGSEPLSKAMLCSYRHTWEMLWARFQTTVK